MVGIALRTENMMDVFSVGLHFALREREVNEYVLWSCTYWGNLTCPDVLHFPDIIYLSEVKRSVYCHYSRGLSALLCLILMHRSPPSEFCKSNLYKS